MEEKKVPFGLVFMNAFGIAFFYGLIAFMIGDLEKNGGIGGMGIGLGYMGVVFFLSLATFVISFSPFSSSKHSRWGWWIVGGWSVISLIVLWILVLHGYFYDPTGLG
jgi:hypothetical protein